jgi:hypothetical protein
MKTKTSPLYFVKSGPPKSPPMEVGCECTAPVGGGRVVFITHSSLADGFKNRQWKHISTGGYRNTTASGNRIFPLAVGVIEPLVKIITANGNMFPLAVPKPGPPDFFTGTR